MTIDYSDPLITTRTRELSIYDPTLLTEWVSGTEVIDVATETITERSFNELQHLPGLELTTLPGAPPSHPDPYAFHYQLRSKFAEHNYSSQVLFVNDETNPLYAFNDFYGWYYNVSLYNRTEYWTDDLAAMCVWQIRSRPDEETPATDKLFWFNAAGDVISSLNIAEAESLSIAVGRTWGLRAAASDPFFDFEMTSSTAESINNFVRHLSYDIPAELAAGMQVLPEPEAPSATGVNAIAPHSLTHPIINITSPITSPRAAYTGEIPQEPANPEDPPLPPLVVPIIKVLAQVNIYIYGAYWVQDYGFINSYDQGALIHPDPTELSIRLKPPGKAYFNDSFTDTTFNENAEWR